MTGLVVALDRLPDVASALGDAPSSALSMTGLSVALSGGPVLLGVQRWHGHRVGSPCRVVRVGLSRRGGTVGLAAERVVDRQRRLMVRELSMEEQR